MFDEEENDENVDIGEFASVNTTTDEKTGRFKIVIEGEVKFRSLLGIKISNLKFTKDEIERFVKD